MDTNNRVSDCDVPLYNARRSPCMTTADMSSLSILRSTTAAL